MQLHERINEVEDRKQKAICLERYRRRDEDPKTVVSEIDDNIEEECGICMEINVKVVLPTCSHAMCIKCYREWYESALPFLKVLIYFSYYVVLTVMHSCLLKMKYYDMWNNF